MKKTMFLCFAVIFCAVSFGQKVKTKNDTAYVDEAPFLVWKTASAGNEVSVSGLQATQEEIFVTYLSYNDPAKVTSSNKEGAVRFIELNFLTLKLKCEIASRMHDGLVKFLIENKIYVDGIFNTSNAELLVQKYGTKFSDSKPANVIIQINTN